MDSFNRFDFDAEAKVLELLGELISKPFLSAGTGDLTLHDNYYETGDFPNGVNVHAGTNWIFLVKGTGTNGLAIGISKCTFAQGGNANFGSQPGTLIVLGNDTGLTGSQEGDEVVFVLLPYVHLTESGDIDPGFILDLLTSRDFTTDPVYVNDGIIGAGGLGAGNMTVNGQAVHLGGS